MEKNQNCQGLYARHSGHRQIEGEKSDIRARCVARLILDPFLSEPRGLRPFIGCGPPTSPTKTEAGRYKTETLEFGVGTSRKELP